MPFSEDVGKRKKYSKKYYDGVNHSRLYSKRKLNYESTLDSGLYDTTVNIEINQVNGAQLNGWTVTQNSWHYALGIPTSGAFMGQDGVVGFGGRKGQNWIKYRLERVGYLHYPTKSWEDIGGAPSYVRARLANSINSEEMPDGTLVNTHSVAEWSRIWATPSGGQIDIKWSVSGDNLKEYVTINQLGRDWIRDNAPPSTPINETYFGFVYRIDPSDIPRWIKNGIPQDIEGDFDDSDGNIELHDAVDRLLAFMPISRLFVGNIDHTLYRWKDGRRNLRKRFYKDGSNYYLLVGLRVDDLLTLPDGDLVFDPSWSESTPAADTDDGVDDDGTWDDSAVVAGSYSGPEIYHGCVSWVISDDLSSTGITVSKAYVRHFLNDKDNDPILTTIRVGTDTTQRWGTNYKPSTATFVLDTSTVARDYDTNNVWHHGESDTNPINFAASLEGLAPSTGDWVNTCIYAEYSGNAWGVFDDYGEANPAQLYAEWTTGAGGTTHNVTCVDASKLSTVRYGKVVFNKSIADGIKLSEVSPVQALFNLITSDSVKLSDTPSVTTVFNLALSDGVKLSDAPAVTIVKNLTAVDAVKLSEVVSGAVDYQLLVTDSAKLSDNALAQIVFNLLSSDATKFSDIPSRTMLYVVSAAEAAKFSDIGSVAVTINLSTIDGVKVSDTPSGLVDFNLLLTDGIKASDTALIQAAFNLLSQDAIKLSEVSPVNVVFNLTGSDAIKLSDLANVLVSIEASCADGIKLDDGSLNAQTIFNLITLDSVKLSDVSLVQTLFNVTSVDVTKFSDTPSVQAIFSVTSVDAAKFSEIISRSLSFSLNVSDAVKFDDPVSVEVVLGGTLFDLNIREGIKLAGGGNEITTVSGKVVFEVNLADGIKVTDLLNAICDYVVNAVDGLKLSDITSVSVSSPSDTPASGELVATVVARGLVGTINVKVLTAGISIEGLDYNLNKN